MIIDMNPVASVSSRPPVGFNDGGATAKAPLSGDISGTPSLASPFGKCKTVQPAVRRYQHHAFNPNNGWSQKTLWAEQVDVGQLPGWWRLAVCHGSSVLAVDVTKTQAGNPALAANPGKGRDMDCLRAEMDASIQGDVTAKSKSQQQHGFASRMTLRIRATAAQGDTFGNRTLATLGKN